MKTWKKVALIVAAFAALVIAGAYLYLVPMGGVREIAQERIDRLVKPEYHLKVQIGEIGGSLISGIVLRDVIIDYTDSLHEYRMAYIPRLTARYSLSGVLSGDYDFNRVSIDSAQVTLIRETSGRFLLPDLSSKSDSTRVSSLPLIKIADLQITGAEFTLVKPSDTLRIENVNLVSSIQLEEKTYAADIRQLSLNSNRKALNLDNAEGKITFSNGELFAQDLSIVRGRNRIKLNGRLNIEEKTGDVDINSDNFDLRNLKELLGVNLRGIIDITGHLTLEDSVVLGSINLGGTFMDLNLENLSVAFTFADKHLKLDTLYGSALGGMSIDGSGSVNFAGSEPAYVLDAQIRNFDLNNLIRGGFVSDLNGTLNLTGTSLSGSRMRILADVSLYESSFDKYALHEAEGALMITADSLRVVDSMYVRYYENEFYVAGDLAYKGDLDVSVRADLRNLDRFKGKFFITEPGGRATADVLFTGKTKDPDLSGSLDSDSLWIYGMYSDSAHGTLDIQRFLTRQSGWVQADMYRGTVYSLPYDSAIAGLHLDSGLVAIDSVFMSAEHSTAYARGSFNYGRTPYELALDSLEIKAFDQTLYNMKTLVVNIDSSGFEFEQVELGNPEASLSAQGRVSYNEEMNLTVDANRIKIAPWLKLFKIGHEVTGLLSFHTTVTGTMLRPQFSLVTTIDSLVYVDTTYYNYEEIPLGDLSASMQYGDRKLTLDSLLVRSAKGEYRADGYIHINLSMTSDSLQRVLDEPLEVSLSATDEEFDLVTVFMPSIEQLNGKFFSQLKLSGTPKEPHLNGYAYVRQLQMKYFDLVDSIYADSAGVIISDNEIAINRLSAYVKDKRRDNRKSYVEVDGSITVKTLKKFDYDLSISIPKEFPFNYELEDIQGVVEGDLTVQGETPPTVSGSLTLISMTYRVPFAEPGGSVVLEALSGENTWDLDLRIDILSNFWIRNSDLDAQMSGYLNLKRDAGVSRFLGQLTFIRGKSYLFDKTFTIDQGSQVIFQDIKELNPTLDITAHTIIVGVNLPGQVQQEQLDLCVHVTGTLDAPEINTCQGSTFTQQDILPLLVANYYSSGDTTTITPFADRMTQLLSIQLSQIVPGIVPQEWKSKIGLETFDINPVYEGGNFKGTSVTVGVAPLSQLYVYGRSTPFAGQYGQEVGFEYRFNQSFLLEGRRTEQDEYVVNLKLHWEF